MTGAMGSSSRRRMIRVRSGYTPRPGRPRTGGRARGWAVSFERPTDGSGTPNWAGSSRWRARRQACGFGRMAWAGCGRTRGSIPSFTGQMGRVGIISTGCMRGRRCFSIINRKNGGRWNENEKFFLQFIRPTFSRSADSEKHRKKSRPKCDSSALITENGSRQVCGLFRAREPFS